PPPHSTPFPYTTLFRSILPDSEQLVDGNRGDHFFVLSPVHQPLRAVEAKFRDSRSSDDLAANALRERMHDRLVSALGRIVEMQLDRKSTRLNSSHEWIS